MAKKTTRKSSYVQRLEDKIFDLQASLDVDKEMRNLNWEDHRVDFQRDATPEEIKEEKRVRVRIKKLQQMLKNAKSRGGGGGGDLGMLRHSGVSSLVKPKTLIKR